MKIATPPKKKKPAVIIEVPKGNCYARTGLVSLDVALSLPSYWSNYVNCLSPRSSMRSESLLAFLLSHSDDEAFVSANIMKSRHFGELPELKVHVISLSFNLNIDWEIKNSTSTRACMSIHWFPLAKTLASFLHHHTTTLGTKYMYPFISKYSPLSDKIRRCWGKKYHVYGIYIR